VTLREGAVRPGVGSGRSWLRFLAGFAVLGAVLLGTAALDATGRRAWASSPRCW
jgi:hypothetical protein